MKTGAIKMCAVLALLALVSGCSPKPDKSIVLWEQPSPIIASLNHASEINGMALQVLPTGSMEPFLTAGDWLVADRRAKFSELKEGDLVIYRANWLPASSPLVCHMLAAWNYDRKSAVMSGIANKSFENGRLSMAESNYVGKVVAVYTKRPKS